MMSCVTLGTALLYTQWSGVDRHAGVCQHVVCRARTVHQLPPGGSAAVNTASPLWYTGGSSWSVISRDICVLFWIRVCFLLSVTENLRGVVNNINFGVSRPERNPSPSTSVASGTFSTWLVVGGNGNS